MKKREDQRELEDLRRRRCEAAASRAKVKAPAPDGKLTSMDEANERVERARVRALEAGETTRALKADARASDAWDQVRDDDDASAPPESDV